VGAVGPAAAVATVARVEAGGGGQVRTPNQLPTTTKAPITARWPSAASGSIEPVVAPRASSAQCHRGVHQAMGRRPAGSCSSGKNVPENSDRGSTISRMMTGKVLSPSWVAANADRGAANATAHSAAANTARPPHAEGTPPISAATATKGTAIIVDQAAHHSRAPK
jgi:hypothetical protein